MVVVEVVGIPDDKISGGLGIMGKVGVAHHTRTIRW